jgi:glycogen debranching enzyme
MVSLNLIYVQWTGSTAHLSDPGLGTLSEIFAEAPYAPRGCMAQTWSVAEVPRA